MTTKDRVTHDAILVDGEFKGMNAIVVRSRKGIRMCISQTLTIRNTHKMEFVFSEHCEALSTIEETEMKDCAGMIHMKMLSSISIKPEDATMSERYFVAFNVASYKMLNF